MALETPATYTLRVNHDGTWHEFGVDARTKVKAWRGRLRSQQEFGVSDAGYLTFTVENYRGQWDFLAGGDRIQLLMHHPSFTGVYPLFNNAVYPLLNDVVYPLFPSDGDSLPIWSGFLERPRNLYEKYGRLASLRALGVFSQLIGNVINIDYRKDITSVEAARLVVEAVGLTLSPIIQSDQSDVFRFPQWWALGDEAIDALLRIQASLAGGWAREGKDFSVQLEHRLHRVLNDGPIMNFGTDGDYFIEDLKEVYRDRSAGTGSAQADGLVTKLTTAVPLAEAILFAADAESETVGFPLAIGAGETENIYIEYPNEESPRSHIGVAPDERDDDGTLVPGWEPIRHADITLDDGAVLRRDYDTNPADQMLNFTYTRRLGGLDVAILNPGTAPVSITRLRFRGHPLKQSSSLSIKTPTTSEHPERTPEGFYPSAYEIREWHDHIRRIRSGDVRMFYLEWIASDDPSQAVSVDLSDRIHVKHEDVDHSFFIESMEHIIGPGDIHRIRFLIVTDNGYPFVPGAPIVTLGEVLRQAVPEAPVVTLRVLAGDPVVPDAPVVSLDSVTAAPVAPAPSVVRSLAAQRTSSSVFLVTYSVPSETGGLAITYEIEYQQVTENTWTSRGTTGSTAVLISSLVPNGTYNIRVRATNANGAGPWATIRNQRLSTEPIQPTVPETPVVTLGAVTATPPPPPAPTNLSPTVDILTAAQTVAGGAAVALRATAGDSDGTIADYQWEAIPNVGVFTNASARDTTWRAPGAISSARPVRLRLTVTDNDGGRAVDEVVITVRASSTGPPATPAPTGRISTSAQTVNAGASVNLQATAAAGAGATITQTRWTATGGSFASASVLNARWTAPRPTLQTVYTLTLTVTQSDGQTDTEMLRITVRGTATVPAAPVVRLGDVRR